MGQRILPANVLSYKLERFVSTCEIKHRKSIIRIIGKTTSTAMSFSAMDMAVFRISFLATAPLDRPLTQCGTAIHQACHCRKICLELLMKTHCYFY